MGLHLVSIMGFTRRYNCVYDNNNISIRDKISYIYMWSRDNIYIKDIGQVHVLVCVWNLEFILFNYLFYQQYQKF